MKERVTIYSWGHIEMKPVSRWDIIRYWIKDILSYFGVK